MVKYIVCTDQAGGPARLVMAAPLKGRARRHKVILRNSSINILSEPVRLITSITQETGGIVWRQDPTLSLMQPGFDFQAESYSNPAAEGLTLSAGPKLG